MQFHDGEGAGMRDMLLYGVGESDRQADLLTWWQQTPGLHEFVPDFHRLQLEQWLWAHRADLSGRVLDVGVQNPRRWMGSGYVTLNEAGGDITGTLLHLPFAAATFDAVVLTEVLEHCTDPFRAVAEVWRTLKAGGLLLVTSPFCWPWHGTVDYRDYWRFTHEGWALLLKAFARVAIRPCEWTKEGAWCYDLLRRFECMGHRTLTLATTGYLCEAIK